MKRIGLIFAIGLAGCVSNSAGNAITSTLTQIANTATSDIQTQINVANAATPPDADGAQCGTAALQVAAAMQKVLAVTAPVSTTTNGTTTTTAPVVGVFTLAEIASLYQPGSAQYQAMAKILVSGCAAKVMDLQQAANANLSVGAIAAAIPTVLALAPVP